MRSWSETRRRRAGFGRTLLLGWCLVALDATAQTVPFVDAESICGREDECFGAMSPECLKLSKREKSDRRHQLNECVEEQQDAYATVMTRLTELKAPDKAECLQRFDRFRDYRVISDCVVQKLTTTKEKKERLDAARGR